MEFTVCCDSLGFLRQIRHRASDLVASEVVNGIKKPHIVMLF